MGTNQPSDNFPVDRVIGGILLMGVLYIVGAQIYIYKIPERFKPGVFDIWVGDLLTKLNSHTIWHIMVSLAATVHLFTLIEAYTVRAQLKCL